MHFNRTLMSLSLACTLGATPVMAAESTVPMESQAVVTHYADLALATYSDALTSARVLHSAIEQLISTPSEQTLQSARTAWIAARVPYQQSEAFRFGNSIVDDWEGRVNAWPLDEGLIDYVATDSYGEESDENPFYSANIIANPILQIGGRTLDASTITLELLSTSLHEIDGVESNVATGYHAIEYLLWGQDLNGMTLGAGERPATDYDSSNCTGGHCDRRGDYLRAASALLVQDLEEMVGNWQSSGAARSELTAKSVTEGLASITTGMGSLAYGELAGERTKLGLMLHDPEEEHDCFSDNTHWSHFYDAKGIQNVYLGQYSRIDGSLMQGPSLSALVASVDPELDKRLRQQLDQTQLAAQVMVDSAAAGEPYDVMIAPGNSAGGARIQAFVDSLIAQTRTTEEVIARLELGQVNVEGSDSLDNPAAVQPQ
jgi:putative iron-regulated protein